MGKFHDWCLKNPQYTPAYQLLQDEIGFIQNKLRIMNEFIEHIEKNETLPYWFDDLKRDKVDKEDVRHNVVFSFWRNEQEFNKWVDSEVYANTTTKSMNEFSMRKGMKTYPHGSMDKGVVRKERLERLVATIKDKMKRGESLLKSAQKKLNSFTLSKSFGRKSPLGLLERLGTLELYMIYSKVGYKTELEDATWYQYTQKGRKIDFDSLLGLEVIMGMLSEVDTSIEVEIHYTYVFESTASARIKSSLGGVSFTRIGKGSTENALINTLLSYLDHRWDAVIKQIDEFCGEPDDTVTFFEVKEGDNIKFATIGDKKA
jgi:hypothetical protein